MLNIQEILKREPEPESTFDVLGRHVRPVGAVPDPAGHGDSTDWRGDHGRLFLPLARALSASGRHTAAGVQLAGAGASAGRFSRHA